VNLIAGGIPDTTTWKKPSYFGRTIALWGLYGAVIPSALILHWAAE
jgi:hypothetical protein